MNTLAKGGLICASVNAQNADGTKGTYQSFDYVATIAEGVNGGTNLATADKPVGLGWDPVVVEVLANWDGGKTIAGFGKLTGTIYGSWVIKMWGSTSGTGTGETNCGANSKIAGYVTMVMGLNADLAASTNCSLTADAKVQWAWTNVLAVPMDTEAKRNSFVICSATEEFDIGGSALATAGDDPYIIVAGGTTKSTPKTFGMGAWSFMGQFIDYNGVTADTDALTDPDTSTHISAWNGVAATDFIFCTDAGKCNLWYLNGSTTYNACWTAIHARPTAVDADRAAIGGYVGSITSCVKHAVDGYSFWGVTIIAAVGKAWSGATNFTAALTSNAISETTGTNDLFQSVIGTISDGGDQGLNLAQVRVIHVDYTSNFSIFFLLTSSEYYHQSILFSQQAGVAYTVKQGESTADLTNSTYGSAWNFWPFLMENATSTNFYAAQTPDQLILCGTAKGKGVVWRATVAGPTPLRYDATVATIFKLNGTAITNGVAQISAPTGGMAQFKGLTQDTNQDKYVQVICLGVQPMYYTTWAMNLDSGAGNGWVLSCYTGIPQCESSLADGYTYLDNATGTESLKCMEDPRYLTWRVMTIKIDNDATVSWYRVDSYWNSAATQFSSTWGVGVRLSTSVASNTDNNGTTNKGKTFVFGYSDGSGIQLNHIAFATTPVASYNVGGGGTNTLTTAAASYTNTPSGRYGTNPCLGSNMQLSGTTDTSGLSSTITEYSDGYKGKITLALEMFIGGATGAWKGVCLVHYVDQYTMSNINGSICFAAVQSSAAGAGPIDFAAGYLMHVPQSTWSPPARVGSLSPAGTALSEAKYSIVYTPAAATSFMFTQGYYATAEWYQPKFSSTYTTVRRYGKGNFVANYCMTGAAATTYFDAFDAGISYKLTGAAYLAIGAISLGTAFLLAV